MLRKAGTDPLAHRQLLEGDSGLPEYGTMLIPPGNVEDLAVLFQAEGMTARARDGRETLRGIDVFDARDGGEFEAGLPGVGEELQRTGADHGMVGDHFGGPKVALQVRVLHELYIAEAGESFAAHRVAGRVDARIEVDPGQVVNRVRILAAGQAPDGDPPGIAIVLFRIGVELSANPCHGLLALHVARLRHALGRHAVLLQDASPFSPHPKALAPRI